jgi:hypothetical protein
MFNGEAFARVHGGGGSVRGSLGVMTKSAGETSAGKMEQHEYSKQAQEKDMDQDRERYKDSEDVKDTAKAKAKAKATNTALSSGKEYE